MSIFSSYKKIFLLGFIMVILVAIPFSIYFAQKRQQTIVRATPSTVLSFEPSSASVKTGDVLSLNIVLDPGTGSLANQVSFVKLSINYDSSKFATVSGSFTTPSLLKPIDSNSISYESGKIIASLSIGADPANVIIRKTKIAILQLKATDTTTPESPNITFDSAPDTQVLSIAASDQTSENVLSTTIPATVTVALAATTPTPTLSPSPTEVPGAPPSLATPTPIEGIGGLPPLPSSLIPVCSSLGVNGPTSGSAPYSLTFTATGSDPDGTISKISFNFGDSLVDLTQGGGIGTSSVSGQIPHTYETPGVYTAYAILTDSDGNLSTPQENCTQTITVTAGEISQISPTLPPAGDEKIIVGLGVLGIVFAIIGGALLLL